MKYIIAIITLCLAYQLQAQTSLTVTERIQLYEQEIAEGQVDELKMLKNYIDLITLCRSIDMGKTYHYFREAVAYAREKEQLDWESAYWRRMAEVYYDLGKSDSSYYCIDKAIALIEGKGFDYEQCANYQVQGGAFFAGYEYEKALEAYLKALELNEKDKTQKLAAQQNILNNLGIEASTYSMIADIYVKLLNYDKAIDYLLRAKKIIEDNPTERIAFVYFTIELNGMLAGIYTTTNQPDKALPLLQKSYEMAVEKELVPEIVLALCRLSSFYYTERKDHQQAFAFAREAQDMAKETSRPDLISSAEKSLMKACFGLKDYPTACRYAEQLLAHVEEEDWENLYDIYGYLIMMYALSGDVGQSEAYLTKYNEAVANLSDINLHNSLQEMEVKYDVQQKELEIMRQQSELERERTKQSIYIAAIVIAVILLLLFIYIASLRHKRNKILAEANATKDKFFSLISHDLKNPAIAQRDALQLLITHAGEWDTESLSRYYEELLISADGQVELLYNLLNWAQVQTGRMPYAPTQFDLVFELRSDIALIKNMADRKEIRLELQIPETAIVTGDRHMLTTVARNLLTNAVKFTDHGGEVRLEIQPEANGRYRITVADTGTGMSREQQESLFRIDRQRSRAGTAGESGSGLGLIVCRELIEKHGSSLHLTSEEGKGSRFWFTL
ncbi:signal transduction histidine kinase [Parabacteroides sp. PFB2-12]|uniref:tetratricopeptide repeat-containing sensor histidine kinase n=1 Tax=unclassified Parabacteroides TaxID=2649774 RepID=UPI002474925E|nr:MULTISPECIES: ATP-binding protein [unclassified Parabacteroides]MDH6343811.1 signal transduction histidine kinase [Parabacteroides sp. PM6-13]MDH6391517.1 signal transduction histidine kinase [Parabacteroides sp. PFB2-12]